MHRHFPYADINAPIGSAVETYYVDPGGGVPGGDGKTPGQAAQCVADSWKRPGVTILYRRGGVVRGAFPKFSGTPDAWVVVGSYGTGPKPVFMKSRSLAGEHLWEEEASSVWRCATPLSDCANLIYDGEKACGAKRWKRQDLKAQGDWYNEGDGLYVCSAGNPGACYREIEFVPHERFMEFYEDDHHILIRDIHVKNAGIHGFWVNGGHHLVFRGCDVSFMGGAVYEGNVGVPPGMTVRYGNAIEVWDKGHDIVVENCRIYENYDGGVDLQGLRGTTIGNVLIRNNTFWNNGFDTFDWSWGVVVENVYFEHNTCLHAGGGWACRTEGRPRLSAFLPDAVGWHVFCTDVAGQSEICIRNNIFYNASRNPMVKFKCSPEALQRVVMDFNCYHQENPDDPLFWLDGRLFKADELDAYRLASGKDMNSIVADPQFEDVASGRLSLSANSPCRNLSIGCEEVK
jgi:hypothetical protein